MTGKHQQNKALDELISREKDPSTILWECCKIGKKISFRGKDAIILD